MTARRPSRRLSKEEIRKIREDAGMKPTSEEEKQSGIFTLTFITAKPEPEDGEDGDSAPVA